MDDAAFRELVSETLAQVPEKFVRLLENVAVLVEDEPTAAVLKENGIGEGEGTLLGLYQGIPRTERGSDYGVGATLPDTITLFRLPILEAAHEEGRAVADVVQETVWHEIAHYMGLDERGVGLREEEGTNRYHS